MYGKPLYFDCNKCYTRGIKIRGYPLLEKSSKVSSGHGKDILDYLDKRVGYTYDYSEKMIKELDGYKEELEDFSSYGNVIGGR